MATFYLDFVNGTDANNGSSWALAWKTLNLGATAARIAPGDTIRIAKTADPTSIGNATWTNKSATVTLATAQTTNIYLDGAWTAANSATASATTSYYKQGANASLITTPAATLTGTKYAYYATGTLDLSSKNAITLWFRNNTTTIADYTRYTIKLCSDTLGDTPVDTFLIPPTISTGRWMPLTISKFGGGNLGSSIRSIALYTGTVSPGNSQALVIDNVLACSSTGLNLTSLISKNANAYTNTLTDDTWHGLQSINGTTVILGNENSLPAADPALLGYYTSGTTPATVTTYVRQPIVVTGTNNTTIQPLQDSGTLGNLITYSGGWNTSSSTQDGDTWIDGFDGAGNTFTSFGSLSYIKWERIHGCRYNIFFASSGSESAGCDINTNIINTGSNPINLNFNNSNLTMKWNNCAAQLISYATSPSVRANYCNFYCFNNTGNMQMFSQGTYYKNLIIGNIPSPLIRFYGYGTKEFGNLTVDNCTSPNIKTAGSGTSQIDQGWHYINEFVFKNNSSSPSIAFGSCNINKLTLSGNGSWNTVQLGYFSVKQTNATAASLPLPITSDYYSQPIAFYNGINNVITDNRAYWSYGNSLSQTTTRHTASGTAWQINITDTSQTSSIPAKIPIAKIACNANALVTVKAYVKLSHATNIGSKLMIQANEIAGVSADVTATKTADTNWEELTITFTPTVAGVAQIYVQAYWLASTANQSVYVDDITVSQA